MPDEMRPPSRVHITGLFTYPVKSCRRIAVSEVTLDALGIRHDRRFLVTRAEDGSFLTQREIPQMAQIIPTVVTESALTLTAPGMPPLTAPLSLSTNAGRTISVTIWKDTALAADLGDEAAQWLSAFLGLPCRLVQATDDFQRAVDPRYAQPGDRVAFADGFPILLASEASLADLNERIATSGREVVPMERFRPNIVIACDGLAPFAEDGWRRLTRTSDGMTLRVVKPSARCSMTTQHPDTGETQGQEPLRTLATFRRTADGKVLFGQNLIPDWYGTPIELRLGDMLEAE